MTEDAMQSELAAVVDRSAKLSMRLRDLGKEIRSVMAERVTTWCAATYYLLVLVTLSAAEKTNIWRGSVLFVAPLFFGALGFIVSDIITSHRGSSIISGISIMAFSLLTLYLLLYSSELSEVKHRYEEASSKLIMLKECLKQQRRQYKQLVSMIVQARSQRKELAIHLEHLQKIRSIEYQRNQLLQLNWRAMRSVEFEAYLEEVLKLLNYKTETTATTGDQGVDLIAIKEGVRVAIQVKGYLNSVSNSAIQEAYAGKAHYTCHYCAVITNSRFTSSAIQLAKSTDCILIHEDNFCDFVMGRLDLLQALHEKVT